MINTENLDELRKIKKLKQPMIIAARDIRFNRKVIEQGLAEVLVFPHTIPKEDKIKYLDSGFNAITARIASKNKIVIAIDLAALRKMDAIDLGIGLARVRQNFKVCSKANARLGYLNAVSKRGAEALLRCLGANTLQSSQAREC